MTESFSLQQVPFDHPDAVALRNEHVAAGDKLYASDPAALHRSGSEGIDPGSVLLTVVAYEGERPVGHACLRRLGGMTGSAMDGELEIKRMYVVPESRGSGVADDLLDEVEQHAREAGAERIVIHTGDRQHAALRFYTSHGYTPIDVYPPYEAVTYSLCFEKILRQAS